MHRIMYRSVRAAGVTDEQVVEGILLPTLRRNRERDITGCLWFGGDLFVQLLEGPAEAVEKTFTRILSDSRHSSVETLQRAMVRAREFARFEMKLIRGEPGDAVVELCGRWGDGVGSASRSQLNGWDGVVAPLVRFMRACRVET